MDTQLSEHPRDMVVVTGLGYEIPAALRTWFADGVVTCEQASASLSHDADPVPLLRVRKTAKFMSKQDRLALCAAARAVSVSGLASDVLETKTLIAMAVGPIPFQESEARDVAEHSCVDSRFSEERFCKEAYEAFNPMLLFSCLPNMPTYHISSNLNMKGGYYLTYPSCAESYLALQNAMDALLEGRSQAVLFGAVVDQQNFLVQNHHCKMHQSLPAPDCACFLVLETLRHAQARKATVLARLCDFKMGSHLQNPFSASGSAQPRPPDSAFTSAYFMEGEPVVSRRGSLQMPLGAEQWNASSERACYLGPVELPLEVARFIEGKSDRLIHRLNENKNSLESEWTR